MRGHFGIVPDGIVPDTTGQFNDSMMNLDPNGSGDDILFTIKLGKDFLLYLHIVFH